MSLIALGINHRTAPVELREQVAISGERISDALRGLTALPSVKEAAILSTCNRTELYCGLQEPGLDDITNWLASYHNLDPALIQPYLYSFPDDSAVRHLLRVAGGLDSMIIGEPQILGQMKEAYQAATDAGTLDSALGRLFQHTFSVAKQIRTDTAIGESPVSVAFAAVSLAKQIFGDFTSQTALLIGAGETIELTARHLRDQQLGRLVIANRTPENAHRLAARFDGYGIGLDEIPAHLAEADIVITATGSPTAILDKAMVKKALKNRKHRPVFMVDIAVPRDIDAEVAELEDIYLYTVDDLQDVIQENLKSRQQAALQAEEIIDVQVERFMSWLRAQDAVATIRDYRKHAEQQRDEVFRKAQHMLEGGKDPQQVLEYLANTLTNKLTHAPSVRIREAAENGDNDLLDAALALFNLDKDKP
ncbi:glutamyl-tRNA reductase [Thiogranum longum]|uniref:Glutamyl-tRNA reductase n=1 Tax=Thiogranum longum TaxID=1537524 RepID=A0A4R1HIG3_9GAMM|nr:glutamyl-tRNA reductase [Thiogranum longum]TCK19219.1 glutamyl-tRNA reductase [Thiogranum longum]